MMIKELLKMVEIFKTGDGRSFFSENSLDEIQYVVDEMALKVCKFSKQFKQIEGFEMNEEDDIITQALTIMLSLVMDIGSSVCTIKEILDSACNKRKKFDVPDSFDKKHVRMISKGIKIGLVQTLQNVIRALEKINADMGVRLTPNCEIDRGYKNCMYLKDLAKDFNHYLKNMNGLVLGTKKGLLGVVGGIEQFLLFAKNYVETVEHILVIAVNRHRLHQEKTGPKLGTRIERMIKDLYEHRVSRNRRLVFDD